MQPLRIYVCGAHSTGKTTLARHVAREMGLPLINEVARQVIAELELSFENLRVNLRQAGEYQAEVFRRQLEIEETFPGGFVSDRSFDNLAYAARHTNILPQLLDEPTNRYFDRVRRSLVFFVRPHPECMSNDGARERVEWDEINRIDGILDFVFSWQRIPCIGISELNMKDRVRTAMSAVEFYRRSCLAPSEKSGNGKPKANGKHDEHDEGNGNGKHREPALTGDASWQ